MEEFSDEFVDIYNNSDIIISKGQGNFEAKKLDVKLNDYVLSYHGKRNAE